MNVDDDMSLPRLWVQERVSIGGEPEARASLLPAQGLARKLRGALAFSSVPPCSTVLGAFPFGTHHFPIAACSMTPRSTPAIESEARQHYLLQYLHSRMRSACILLRLHWCDEMRY